MASDFNKPTTTSTYTDYSGEVRENVSDVAKMFEGTSGSNIPTGSKQLENDVEVNRWNGSSWDVLGHLLPASVTGGIQTTITDSDTHIPTSGAVVDYAVDLARIQTTITDDDAKIPSSGAVVDYVASQNANLAGFVSYASTATSSQTWSVASSVGSWDSSSRIMMLFNFTASHSSVIALGQIKLIYDGTSGYYYVGNSQRTSTSAEAFISNSSGSGASFSATVQYTSTPYSFTVSGTVGTNTITSGTATWGAAAVGSNTMSMNAFLI